MFEFKMPTLGAEMEAGRLVEWKVKPGDRVKKGDIVAVVDTDKAAIDVEIWQSGVVDQILVEAGQKVAVGTPLALLKTGTEEAGPAQQEPSRAKITPAARKRATELGVDPSKLRGTGPEGSISITDVEGASAREVKPQNPPSEVDRKTAMRAAIAAAMARSKREIPHYYLSSEIDVTRAIEWLAAENLKRPVEKRLLQPVLLLKAVALALKKVPELNGYWKDSRFEPSEAVNIGVAISLRGGGLIAPALRDVDQKTLDAVMQELQDLVNRTRAGGLKSSELSDSTITVTNLGEQGVDSVLGVIYPPQVALVGFGKVVSRPRVLDNAVLPRSVVTATLSADHRVSDGHRGAVFLSTVDHLLQEPEKL